MAFVQSLFLISPSFNAWEGLRCLIEAFPGYLHLYVTGEKTEITFFPDRGSNPVRWTQSPTHYHVAIKAGLYRKAVQVFYLYPVTFSPSNLKFVPEFLGVRESREMRLKEFYAHMWVIYVGRQM